jgi:hypothetical protein
MGIRERIEGEVGGWPGVEMRAHRFGGVEFRVNGHEMGTFMVRGWRISRFR